MSSQLRREIRESWRCLQAPVIPNTCQSSSILLFRNVTVSLIRFLKNERVHKIIVHNLEYRLQ